MQNAKRKIYHSYRLSYAHGVGSSFDPDLEDVGGYENELRGTTSDVPAKPLPLLTQIAIDIQSEVISHVKPQDLEQEIEAYAEEYVPLGDFEVLLSPFVRVDNRTSGSRQLDLGPAFRIYVALSVILDPQQALNIGYLLQKFSLYCDPEFRRPFGG